MMIRTVMALLLAGATAYAAPAARRDMTDEARLAKALEGRMPGQPQSCISVAPSRSSRTFGNTVLFEGFGGRVYRTQLMGGCVARSYDTLVTRTSQTSLCRGDIVTLTDLSAGYTRESCAYSDFTPYSRR